MSIDSPHSGKVLSDESVTELLQNLALKSDHSPVEGGYRSFSDTPTSSISMDSLDSQATVEIPEFLQSADTFKFLEFNSATVQPLWWKYNRLNTHYPGRVDLLQYARYHVNKISGDAVYERDDWVGLMEKIGLTKNFQGRLMVPEAAEMRSMASAKEWIIHMITIRYEFLESLDNVLKTPSRGVHRPASLTTESERLGSLDTNSHEVPKHGSSDGRFPSMAKFKFGPFEASEPPDKVEGCEILYQAGAMNRLESIFKKYGALDFNQIRSDSPTDFSSETKGLYLITKREAALAYAQMIARLVDGSVVPVGILQVAIPDHLCSAYVLDDGENWRRYVWSCRNKEGPLLDDLSHNQELRWVLKPMCKQGRSRIKKMKDSSELDLWRPSNGQAVRQIFTSNQHMIKSLSEHCVGKVWVTSLATMNRERSGLQGGGGGDISRVTKGES